MSLRGETLDTEAAFVADVKVEGLDHTDWRVWPLLLNMTNATLQVPDSFRRGMYGLANLLYYPVDNVMAGGEFIWGRRDNFTDGWVYNDYRIQFSFRYNFSFTFGGS